MAQALTADLRRSAPTGRSSVSWPSVAVGVWVHLSLGLAVFAYFHPMTHSVYGVYERAARNWWSGVDLYQSETDDYFRYSPLFAITTLPFAWLPMSWGGALWRLFNYGLYAAGLWSWVRHVGSRSWSSSQVAGLFLLVLPLSFASMQNGQANLLMLGSLLLATSAAAQERWTASAGWLAAATLIKGYPLALAMLLSALYPRRFAGRFLLWMALGLGLPFLAQTPSFVRGQYASWLSHLSASTVIMRERVRSVDHLFWLTEHPLTSRELFALQALSGLGVLVVCGMVYWRTTEPRARLLVVSVLFMTWVILFGPATEACTYVVIAPALAWSLLDAWPGAAQLPRWLLCTAFLLMGPATTDLVGSTLRNFANEHGSQPIGALVYLGTMLAYGPMPWRMTGRASEAIGLPASGG